MSNGAFAQTGDEIFNQNKTQRRYLIEQLAALKVYAGYLKKGYTVARDGIGTIRNISNGEFSLHRDFLGSLKAISPTVRRNPKLFEILTMQLEIIAIFSSLRKTQGLQAIDLEYVAEVKRRVVSDLDGYLDDLISLTTPTAYQMEDEERIARLNALHANVLDTFQFSGSFAADARTLGANRLKEQHSINQIKQAYENDRK
ncbi:hypothetical protein [Daejeonella sp.]|uniref:hypothetical protein n=1 Tax=Daejeonella sp. TaxID=2805397 RepID=UPI0030ED61E2